MTSFRLEIHLMKYPQYIVVLTGGWVVDIKKIAKFV